MLCKGEFNMATELLMTQEGYEALKKELNELKSVTRGEISEKIRVARGFGDLSENSEYDEAKNEQAVVEARIKKLEDQLKAVKIISKDQISTDKVTVGCRVKILDMEFDEEMEYVIASSVESHSDLDSISDESPVGKGLLGHKVGDVVEIHAPAETLRLKILEIGI
jgi:transcription elongation factor GreA